MPRRFVTNSWARSYLDRILVGWFEERILVLATNWGAFESKTRMLSWFFCIFLWPAPVLATNWKAFEANTGAGRGIFVEHPLFYRRK